MFGSTQPNNSFGSFSFGGNNNTNNNTNNNNSNIFSTPNNNQNTSIFGNNQQNQTSSFSNTNNASSNLFGQQTNQLQPQTNSFLTSSIPNTNNFSNSNTLQQQQQQQQQTNTNLFNSQPTFSWSRPNDQKPAFNGTSLLGSSITGNPNSILGQSHQNNLSNQSNSNKLPAQPVTSSGPSVINQLSKLKSSWDPSSLDCVFRYFFYNHVPTEQAVLYKKPDNVTELEWETAIANKPDTSSVPVLSIGFNDLQKRASFQEQQIAIYRTRMHEINDKLNALQTRYDLYTSIRTSEIRARNEQLIHRTLRLAVKVQVLKSRGFALRPDEEIIKRRFENLVKEIEDPAVFGRINEVWARMSVIRERTRMLEAKNSAEDNVSSNAIGSGGIAEKLSGANANSAFNEYDWTRETDQMEKVKSVLRDQQTGVSRLISVLNEDLNKVDSAITKLNDKLHKSNDDRFR